ncbi:uncharacterized protein EI97DRAFT_454043 [Westerdykella ornata]|uniref:Uncharacterized protein n=1 Tax=Westerdykella ornata TaxID=318751 RepID=A0A6A6K0C7_WESOR|nr:uncharacterized protein EI97DRAFT_454043 [Westerdykella ornata]KAF2280799.1 hypothetical protein EI97DRAFT_454043 [Westerdykella ornata]
MGEPGRWASKVALLKHFLQRQMPGSHVTIEVDCAPNPSLLKGYYNDWYTSLRKIREEFPSNVTIKVLDSSILTADAAAFYPPPQEQGATPEQQFKWECDRRNIDEIFDFCRKFVNDMSANMPATTSSAREQQNQVVIDLTDDAHDNRLDVESHGMTSLNAVDEQQETFVDTHSLGEDGGDSVAVSGGSPTISRKRRRTPEEGDF